MDFTEVERREAKAFGQFFVNKLENHRQTLKYYLSDEVVLDWFGQTVKGEKNVTAFLKKTLATVHHILTDAIPAKKIGFRDTHIVKIPREPKLIPIGLLSPPRIINQRTETKTPKKQSDPSTSSRTSKKKDQLKEKGQGDGFHNVPEMPLSPAKKFKSSAVDFLDNTCETVESEGESLHKVKYMTTEGAIEFRRPSIKKFQSEMKWRRPCKLSVAYSTNFCDYTMYLIIYEGNVKCRRNLMKDFEAENPEK